MDVSTIPPRWSAFTFDQVLRKVAAKDHQITTNEYRSSGALPVVDQGQEPIVGYCDRLDKRLSCPVGGVIVFGDHTRVIKFVDFDFVVGADGTQILQSRPGHDTRFLAYVLASREIPNTGYNRHFKFLKEMVFALPPLPEQRAIAAALADVDALIAALDQLIAKKRELKTATMQQLLTGQRRLPGCTGAWETRTLGEIASIEMGRTPSRANASYWGRGHTWLSIADLQAKVVSSSREEITARAVTDTQMRCVPAGTLLMSFKLSIGRLCFAGCDLFTNEAICSFGQPTVDAGFLYYALSRTDFALYGKQAVKGYTLNKASLKNIEVSVPPTKREAQEIANALSDIDNELAALEDRRAKTRLIKQGMMHELLTGRTHLVEMMP